MANKKVKSLLHLAGRPVPGHVSHPALHSTQSLLPAGPPVRKVKEGKNKIGPPMRLLLNNVASAIRSEQVGAACFCPGGEPLRSGRSKL